MTGFLITKQTLIRQIVNSNQLSSTRLRLISENGHFRNHQFSVLNEFSNNKDFQKKVQELKQKAGELNEVKEELKSRTKKTSEKLYKQVDGAWSDVESKAKKVSANVKEAISAATEEVKGTFGIGKQESSGSPTGTKAYFGDVKFSGKATSEKQTHHHSGPNTFEQTYFGILKSTIFSLTPKVSEAFQKFKDTKAIDLTRRGIDILKDELTGNTSKRKHMQHKDSSSSPAERSTRSDIVIVPLKQSQWSKKWDKLKEKLQGYPLYKRLSGLSEPVVTKSQELAEEVRERWETSDHPVVHKIQDMNESLFGETHAALSIKEIRRRDPSFSLLEFVAEVQEVVQPVLKAYIKGDSETLKKYCSDSVIKRCQAERQAYASQGIFFDNKILHVSDVELRETKLMGSTPTIILGFQTQQIHCVRDKQGFVTEGGKDTIHTVYYAWAMQPKEEDATHTFPIWELREMQTQGVQALI